MSKEAKEFIYGTDLIDQHDYHDNDCGEGFLIPPSHLATILEAYHQEQTKDWNVSAHGGRAVVCMGDKVSIVKSGTVLVMGAHSLINDVTSPAPKESGTGVKEKCKIVAHRPTDIDVTTEIGTTLARVTLTVTGVTYSTKIGVAPKVNHTLTCIPNDSNTLRP